MSWDRIQTLHRSLPSTTMNWMLSASSPTSDNLSLYAVIDQRIGKAASTLARLTARVWASLKLYVKTKMAAYKKKYACFISTLLYGSETWTTLCRAGEKAQHIPPEKHPPHPGNILAGQSNQRCCLVWCWSSQYTCTLCLDNADCDGLVMSTVWRMVALKSPLR